MNIKSRIAPREAQMFRMAKPDGCGYPVFHAGVARTFSPGRWQISLEGAIIGAKAVETLDNDMQGERRQGMREHRGRNWVGISDRVPSSSC